MSRLSPTAVADLKEIAGDKAVLTNPKVVLAMSQDHYWFSPVLKPQLEAKRAELIVQPSDLESLAAVIAYAYAHDIPLTARGSGTGNYGQGMPMQGGIVLSTNSLRDILELTPIRARVQAGVRLGSLERQARLRGAELRIYPSSYATATVGGFIAGGAGGIGSVTWGTLWDEGNVLAARVLTMEAQPRLLDIQGHEALQAVIHSCGLTCIIVEITLALAPAQPWQQYSLSFPDFLLALRFGERLAYDETISKRLISLHEAPIPSFFSKLVQEGLTREDEALVLLETTMDPDDLKPLGQPYAARITWHGPHEHYRGVIKLSDYSWNHTTHWAMKADPSITYLQDAYDRERVLHQLQTRRDRFPQELLHHIEFMRFQSPAYPQGMTLLRYQNEARLREIQAYSEALGIGIADAHSHLLDDDSRWNGQSILDAKRRWDPKSLLNPGHLKASL